jgi:hypothetical protein
MNLMDLIKKHKIIFIAIISFMLLALIAQLLYPSSILELFLIHIKSLLGKNRPLNLQKWKNFIWYLSLFPLLLSIVLIICKFPKLFPLIRRSSFIVISTCILVVLLNQKFINPYTQNIYISPEYPSTYFCESQISITCDEAYIINGSKNSDKDLGASIKRGNIFHHYAIPVKTIKSSFTSLIEAIHTSQYAPILSVYWITLYYLGVNTPELLLLCNEVLYLLLALLPAFLVIVTKSGSHFKFILIVISLLSLGVLDIVQFVLSPAFNPLRYILLFQLLFFGLVAPYLKLNFAGRTVSFLSLIVCLNLSEDPILIISEIAIIVALSFITVIEARTPSEYLFVLRYIKKHCKLLLLFFSLSLILRLSLKASYSDHLISQTWLDSILRGYPFNLGITNTIYLCLIIVSILLYLVLSFDNFLSVFTRSSKRDSSYEIISLMTLYQFLLVFVFSFLSLYFYGNPSPGHFSLFLVSLNITVASFMIYERNISSLLETDECYTLKRPKHRFLVNFTVIRVIIVVKNAFVLIATTFFAALLTQNLSYFRFKGYERGFTAAKEFQYNPTNGIYKFNYGGNLQNINYMINIIDSKNLENTLFLVREKPLINNSFPQLNIRPSTFDPFNSSYALNVNSLNRYIRENKIRYIVINNPESDFFRILRHIGFEKSFFKIAELMSIGQPRSSLNLEVTSYQVNEAQEIMLLQDKIETVVSQLESFNLYRSTPYFSIYEVRSK